MKKTFRIIALVLFLPAMFAVVIVAVLVIKIESLAIFKSALVNVYSGAPAAIVLLDLRQSLRNWDFGRTIKTLRRQLSIAEVIGLTSFMKHDLL